VRAPARRRHQRRHAAVRPPGRRRAELARARPRADRPRPRVSVPGAHLGPAPAGPPRRRSRRLARAGVRPRPPRARDMRAAAPGVETVATPNAPPVAGPYSPAVRAGDWYVLSGQIGLGPDGTLVGGGAAAQAAQVLANVTAVLGDVGCAWSDV